MSLCEFSVDPTAPLSEREAARLNVRYLTNIKCNLASCFSPKYIRQLYGEVVLQSLKQKKMSRAKNFLAKDVSDSLSLHRNCMKTPSLGNVLPYPVQILKYGD